MVKLSCSCNDSEITSISEVTIGNQYYQNVPVVRRLDFWDMEARYKVKIAQNIVPKSIFDISHILESSILTL